MLGMKYTAHRAFCVRKQEQGKETEMPLLVSQEAAQQNTATVCAKGN